MLVVLVERLLRARQEGCGQGCATPATQGGAPQFPPRTTTPTTADDDDDEDDVMDVEAGSHDDDDDDDDDSAPATPSSNTNGGGKGITAKAKKAAAAAAVVERVHRLAQRGGIMVRDKLVLLDRKPGAVYSSTRRTPDGSHLRVGTWDQSKERVVPLTREEMREQTHPTAKGSKERRRGRGRGRGQGLRGRRRRRRR